MQADPTIVPAKLDLRHEASNMLLVVLAGEWKTRSGLTDVSAVQDGQFENIGQRMVSTLEAMEKLIASPGWTDAIQSLTRTSEETRRFVADLRTEVRPVVGSLTNAAEQASQTLEEVHRTLEELRGVAGAESPLVGQLNDTLTEFSDAARSIRLLADYLNRNPSALLGGRKHSESKP